MDIKAEQKYILISPQKVRAVVEMIKKLSPSLAAESLVLVAKRGAMPLRKVILSALANAKNKGLSETDMVFKEIQIGEGPRLKRGNPVSRGQWHPIKKRMSHIKVILTTKGETAKTEAETKNTEPKEKKAETKKEMKGETKNGTKS
jgi:large subunit ribosomal protein L22